MIKIMSILMLKWLSWLKIIYTITHLFSRLMKGLRICRIPLVREGAINV